MRAFLIASDPAEAQLYCPWLPLLRFLMQDLRFKVSVAAATILCSAKFLLLNFRCWPSECCRLLSR